VPQVVVPLAFDQHVWAADVVKLGVGTAIPEDVMITTESVIHAVECALSTAVATAARELGQRLAFCDDKESSGVEVAAGAMWRWFHDVGVIGYDGSSSPV
jgi:UDP:flavonoid glycosyltransferase YjiC (YdhE family)